MVVRMRACQLGSHWGMTPSLRLSRPSVDRAIVRSPTLSEFRKLDSPLPNSAAPQEGTLRSPPPVPTRSTLNPPPGRSPARAIVPFPVQPLRQNSP